uniref:BHLH domain-containing protein n=1 Tax=Anopheles dirus TaxID=7168 RepID=A0A9I3E2H7_9DIPT
MPKRKKAPSPKFDLLEDGFDDDLSSNDDKPGTPIQRNAANARERARMRVLSKAFFNLKRNIPWVPADTKLSKLDTLRLAKNYITYLAATLDGQSVEDFSTNLAQPPKTAWPFIFQQVQPHETSKSKHQQQPQPTTPPNVGQSTCSTDQQKWLDFHQKDVTSGRLGPENIKSQSVAPSNVLLGFPENHAVSSSSASSSSSMEGVIEYGAFGDPLGIAANSAAHHQHPQQQESQQHQHHHQHQHHPHQRPQHSLMPQDQHQLHQHAQHYQTSGGMPMHTDGCHMGGAMGMSGAYHRQHMASIGSMAFHLPTSSTARNEQIEAPATATADDATECRSIHMFHRSAEVARLSSERCHLRSAGAGKYQISKRRTIERLVGIPGKPCRFVVVGVVIV